MLSSHPPPAAASASSSSSTSSSPVSALLPSSSTTVSALNHSSRSSRKDEIICQVALDCPSDFLQCTDPPVDGIGLLNNGTLTKSLLSSNVPKAWKSALDCVQCVEAFHTDTMNHCVPEWDATGRDLDVMWDPTELFSLSKGKWDLGQTRRLDLAFVPDHDFEELCWEDGQLLVVMQGLSGKSILKNRSCWQVSAGEVAPSACGLPAAGMDSTFYTLGTGESMDPSTVNMHTQEDELLSWLQHPSDELVDKLEIPGDATNSNAPSRGCERLCPGDLIHHDIPQNTVNADDSGVGPTSKNLRHETFLPFQTTMLHKPGHDHGDINQHIHVNALMRSNITPATIMTSKEQFEHGPMMARLEMPPPQMHSAIASATRSESTTSMNFSNFSRPAAAFKANLHSIGMASGPSGMERLKQLDRVAVDSESIDSRTKHFRLIAPRREGDALPPAVPNISECVGASVVHHPAESFSLGREAEQDVSANGAMNGSSGMVGKSYGWNSSVISSTALGTDRSTEVLEVAELSDTSSSGGSEECDGANGKGAAGVGKRKVYDEDSEVQSRTLENEASGTDKHAMGGGNSMKRSRAAENHNQSERRRRDRISEKMKALQALVPNSHKTDKASMLEEAITYIKALKGQIQMMSYTSRMCFSPMLIPQGMQHVQMGAWPHMGMGMGMGVGVGVGVGMGMGMGMGAGIGMLDMTTGGAATTARQFPPLLSIPGAAMPTVHAIPSATLDSALPVHGFVKHLVSPPAHQILPARPGNPAAGTHDSLQTPNVVPHKLFPASQRQPVQCTSPQSASPQIVATKVYGNGVPHSHQHPQPTTFMLGRGPLQQQ